MRVTRAPDSVPHRVPPRVSVYPVLGNPSDRAVRRVFLPPDAHGILFPISVLGSADALVSRLPGLVRRREQGLLQP